MGRRVRTKTSTFGASYRVNHDATIFYARKINAPAKRKARVVYKETPVPASVINTIQCRDSKDMSILPEACVHLMVTSPPYNTGKVYDEDLSLDEYLSFLRNVFSEVYRVLVPGGRACVNITNIGRKPTIPLHSYVIQDMTDIGFLMRGEIIWYKGVPGGSCAWGSWRSASNPVLRDAHEYILVFSKKTFSRPKEERKDTISRDEFLSSTQSLWSIRPEYAKRVGHPAPFPVEIPYRLIHLYSFQDDVVLDPFCGSGTTCVAAVKAQRRYVGFDVSEEYVEMARRRIEEEDHKELSGDS